MLDLATTLIVGLCACLLGDWRSALLLPALTVVVIVIIVVVVVVIIIIVIVIVRRPTKT